VPCALKNNTAHCEAYLQANGVMVIRHQKWQAPRYHLHYLYMTFSKLLCFAVVLVHKLISSYAAEV
jgi:hypothetical protein